MCVRFSLSRMFFLALSLSHTHTLTHTHAQAMPVLRRLRTSSKRTLQQRCDSTGFNLAALRSMKRRLAASAHIEEESSATLPSL